MGQKFSKIPIIICMGIRFSTITQSFVGQSGWNGFWELRKLLSINCWREINGMVINDQFQISIFWALIGGKMGVATTSGPKNPTKKLRSFWVTYYLKIMLPDFLAPDPLKQKTFFGKLADSSFFKFFQIIVALCHIWSILCFLYDIGCSFAHQNLKKVGLIVLCFPSWENQHQICLKFIAVGLFFLPQAINFKSNCSSNALII